MCVCVRACVYVNARARPTGVGAIFIRAPRQIEWELSTIGGRSDDEAIVMEPGARPPRRPCWRTKTARG